MQHKKREERQRLTLFKLIPQDKNKNKNKVSAGTERSFTFYGEISSDLRPEDLIIRVFKWDFTQENYEYVLGDMQTSTSAYTAAASYGDKKLFEITGVAMEANVSRVLLNRNDKNTLITIYVKLLNSGSTSFDIPDLRYLIKTTDGSVFPAELGKSGEKLLVQPGESKEIQINAIIPVEYDMGKGLELLFAQTIPEAGSQPIETRVVPLASFSLLTDNQESVGNRISAELQAIQRLPWEDKDLLSGNLVIRNPSSKLLSVPRMTGYFNIFPFELSLSSFKTRANLYTDELSISFRTELIKDGSVEASTEGHNLFIEINDSKSEVNFSERVVLEASNNMNSQPVSKIIKLGSGKYTIGARDDDFIMSFNFSGEYQLNIYDEYMGYKRLVTSKSISWFGSLD